eukprot:599346_1
MSRLGHGLRGATRRMSFQSSFKPSFSSNYTRFASASSFTQSTKSAPTMTMSYPQTMSAMTPSCMVFSSISLTPNMEQGSHLIGLGSTSSALSEEEEEDDVIGYNSIHHMFDSNDANDESIEMIKASQRTVYSILCIQYLALFMHGSECWREVAVCGGKFHTKCEMTI